MPPSAPTFPSMHSAFFAGTYGLPASSEAHGASSANANSATYAGGNDLKTLSGIVFLYYSNVGIASLLAPNVFASDILTPPKIMLRRDTENMSGDKPIFRPPLAVPSDSPHNIISVYTCVPLETPPHVPCVYLVYASLGPTFLYVRYT